MCQVIIFKEENSCLLLCPSVLFLHRKIANLIKQNKGRFNFEVTSINQTYINATLRKIAIILLTLLLMLLPSVSYTEIFNKIPSISNVWLQSTTLDMFAFIASLRFNLALLFSVLTLISHFYHGYTSALMVLFGHCKAFL